MEAAPRALKQCVCLCIDET